MKRVSKTLKFRCDHIHDPLIMFLLSFFSFIPHPLFFIVEIGTQVVKASFKIKHYIVEVSPEFLTLPSQLPTSGVRGWHHNTMQKTGTLHYSRLVLTAQWSSYLSLQSARIRLRNLCLSQGHEDFSPMCSSFMVLESSQKCIFQVKIPMVYSQWSSLFIKPSSCFSFLLKRLSS